MTNPDTNLDEKAKDVVEWMDGWSKTPETYEHESGKIREHPYKEFFEREGGSVKLYSVLYTSLDVIREVEESIRDTEFWVTYIDVLSRDLPYDRGKPIGLFEIATADPKTRLLAIHKTLREVEEIDNDPEN